MTASVGTLRSRRPNYGLILVASALVFATLLFFQVTASAPSRSAAPNTLGPWHLAGQHVDASGFFIILGNDDGTYRMKFLCQNWPDGSGVVKVILEMTLGAAFTTSTLERPGKCTEIDGIIALFDEMVSSAIKNFEYQPGFREVPIREIGQWLGGIARELLVRYQ